MTTVPSGPTATFSFEKTFSQGFAIFKQRFLSLYAVLALMVVIGFAISILGQIVMAVIQVPVAVLVGAGTDNQDAAQIALILASVLASFIVILINIPLNAFSQALTFKPLCKLGRDQAITSEDFSSGLTWNKLKNLMLAQLLFFGIALTAILVVTIPLTIYLAVRYGFVLYLVADKDMSIGQAMEESTRVTKGNILGLIGFFIVNGLLAAAGLLLCCVGVLVTGPLGTLNTTVVYNQLIGEAPSA